MNPIAPFLEQQGYVVLDGALATELERRGADLRDPLWSAKGAARAAGKVPCEYLYESKHDDAALAAMVQRAGHAGANLVFLARPRLAS